MSEVRRNSEEVDGTALEAFVERVEAMNSEIKDRNEDKAAIFAEAKARGFDVPVLKEVIKRRAKDPDKRHEFESLLDLYLSALGLS